MKIPEFLASRSDLHILAVYQGGSHLYGLENENSDIDYRFVYVPRHREKLLGLGVGEKETIDVKDNGIDLVGYELRHFMRMLKKQNTAALELLFSNRHTYIHDVFKILLDYKYQFLDSQQLYDSLKGYIHAERRLATGERTGAEGGKRHEALNRYGFSPKNFVQLIRLCLVGINVMKKGVYCVHISEFTKEEADLLSAIKNKPETFTKDQLVHIVAEYEKNFDAVASSAPFQSEFNEDLANRICFQIYKHFINQEDQIVHPLTKNIEVTPSS